MEKSAVNLSARGLKGADDSGSVRILEVRQFLIALKSPKNFHWVAECVQVITGLRSGNQVGDWMTLLRES